MLSLTAVLIVALLHRPYLGARRAAAGQRAAAGRRTSPQLDTSDDLSGTTSAASLSFSVTLLSSINDVSRREWDALALPDESPFVEWDWLYALEASGCACAETGWTPQHLVVCRPGSSALVAAMPLYLKSHSMGDFVDDQPWADAARADATPYYPKLVSAVPFTPVQGSRVLLSEALSSGVRAQLLLLLARHLRSLAQQLGVASVHLHFCTREEAAAFAQAGFVHRVGLQYNWANANPPDAAAGVGAPARARPYRDFGEFLQRFRSKRRLTIRRERRAVAATHTTELLRGEAVSDELLGLAFAAYKRTVDARLLGRQYLNPQFFAMLRRFRHRLAVLVVRRRRADGAEGEVVALAFNVHKRGVLYGRYWGSLEPRRAAPYLHFEACYYAPIDLAIRHGWARVEVGAGASEYKFLRGFEPSAVHSSHWMGDAALHAAVASHVARQRDAHRAALRRLGAKAVLKPRPPPPTPLQAEATLEPEPPVPAPDEGCGAEVGLP